MDFSKLLHGFVNIDIWIPIFALPCKSLPFLILAQIVGFVKVVRWISLSCYVNLSKFIYGAL